MSFPRADELKTPPVVGKFYMVPCIWAGREWWPITGPQHEDAEIIGFKTQHRHYDLRFVSPLQMDRLCERGWWKRALHWPAVVLIYVSGQVAPLEIRETSVMTAIEKWRTAMALDVAYETAPVVALLRQVRDEVCGLRKTKRTEAGPNEAV